MSDILIGNDVEQRIITAEPPLQTYEQFLQRNISEGILRVRVSTARDAMPVKDAQVTITKTFTDKAVEFFIGRTDEDGVISEIALPAPSRENSVNPYGILAYTYYDVDVSHPDYQTQKLRYVVIFENIKSVLPVNLIPKTKE